MNNGSRRRNAQGICIEDEGNDEDASSFLSVYIRRGERKREKSRTEYTEVLIFRKLILLLDLLSFSFLSRRPIRTVRLISGREREHFSSVMFFFFLHGQREEKKHTYFLSNYICTADEQDEGEGEKCSHPASWYSFPFVFSVVSPSRIYSMPEEEEEEEYSTVSL